MTGGLGSGRVIGGPLDGQVREVFAPRMTVAVVTEEYSRAYGEWFDQYGVAWTVENLESLKRHPVTPRPPPYPEVVYRWEREGDEWVARVESGPA